MARPSRGRPLLARNILSGHGASCSCMRSPRTIRKCGPASRRFAKGSRRSDGRKTTTFKSSITIPIVFSVVNDPLGQGFVASLARPGGNITGFTFVEFTMVGKWLEMLKEIAPSLRRVALIFNPQTAPYYPIYLHEFGAVPATLAAELVAAPVRDEAEVEAAVAALAREPAGGLIAAPDPFINTRRGLIMALAKRYRLPVIYGFRHYVTEGALMSYGPDTADIVRRSASYVDRILKGEKPADLPVQAPTKFELVINLKTAKALDLTVPSALLAQADEVIE